MLEGKTHTLFLRYAVPQMVGLLFNSVYTIVDGVFIGNRLGRDAMAAAAVAVPLVEALISLALAVASGAGVIIATRLGQGEEYAARKIFSDAVWMLGIAGILIAALGNILLHPLARLLGAPPHILGEAADYLRFIVTFAPFQLFSFLLGGMVRNDGWPKLAMTAMILGAVSNITLDYVFMYPLSMGIKGAALATALGPIFSVLLLLPHFLAKRGRLYFQSCRPPRVREIRGILVCGFPSFIMEFSIGMITFIYNFAISFYGYGEMGLAAYLVIGYLMLILLTLFLGMAEGLQPVFSYIMATGEIERNRAMRRFSTVVFICVGLVCYGLILPFSENFILVFSPNDPDLIAFAKERCPVYFCGFFLAGFNILMVSFWQSTGVPGKALAVSLLRSVILTPTLIIVLPSVLGREAMWACLSTGECLAACYAAGMLILTSAKQTGKTTGENPVGKKHWNLKRSVEP